MFLYQIFVLISFLAIVSCAYIPEQANDEYSEIYSILKENGGYEPTRLRRFIPDRFKANLIRSKRQSSSLQQALQNLQNTQQQQSQGQRRPGQNNGQFGNGGNSFGQGGFDNGGQGFGQNGGFSNGGDSGAGTGPGGFNQGGFGGNQGQGGFGGNQGGNANNQGQGGQPWTTVRNPLNVIINENTVPEADCIRRCLAVNNYNPVCGSDDVTYSNRQKLGCAQQCGRQVSLVYNGSCVTTTTPASARPGSFN